MSKIEDILKISNSKNILFLGKIISLTSKEIETFLEKKGLNFCQKYEEGKDYALVVLSSLLNPYEEELSYELYNRGIKDIKLDEFEAYYIANLNPNSLLMSIKLKKDTNRVKRLLRLSSLDNNLYLKLFKIHNWGEEGLFDTDENRDVTVSFIKRFLQRGDRVNHNEIVHSPASLFEIALTSQDEDILEAMLKFPKYEVRSRGKEEWKPRELKEFIATNPNINDNTVKFLLSLRDSRVDSLLALNSKIKPSEQEAILNRSTTQAKINLTKNSNLDDTIFKILLKSKVKQELLLNQKITKERLNLIESKDLIYLATNSTISDIVDHIIFKKEDIDFILARNSVLNKEQLQSLYNQHKEKIAMPLSSNKNTPKELLAHFFSLDSWDITLNLASNPNTPTDILDKLCQMDKRELNINLASNESVSDDYLEIFKVDSTLLRELSKNKKFLKKMENKPII